MEIGKPMLCTKENRAKNVAGLKTNTRRVIMPQPEYENREDMYWWKGDWDTRGGPRAGVCTHGSRGHGEPTWGLKEIAEHARYSVGEIVWQQEPYQMALTPNMDSPFVKMKYLDDNKVDFIHLTVPEWEKWKARKKSFSRTSARYMYKSLARHFYEITAVKVERVQDISEDDAEAEGGWCDKTHREGFGRLWDSINEKRGYGWDKNPWVWVYSYRKVEI